MCEWYPNFDIDESNLNIVFAVIWWVAIVYNFELYLIVFDLYLIDIDYFHLILTSFNANLNEENSLVTDESSWMSLQEGAQVMIDLSLVPNRDELLELRQKHLKNRVKTGSNDQKSSKYNSHVSKNYVGQEECSSEYNDGKGFSEEESVKVIIEKMDGISFLYF